MNSQSTAQSATRPDFAPSPNGPQAVLPFTQDEYESRLKGLRQTMLDKNIDAVLLTSMQNIAYYSGFLYCSFGRPYGFVVTAQTAVAISAGIDGGQPGRRSAFESLTYTDWQRDNYWRCVKSVIGQNRVVGYESDHLTLAAQQQLVTMVAPSEMIDIAPATMQQRMIKSAAETDLIRQSAHIADQGGDAIRAAIHQGTREIDVAMAGRDAMELAIAKQFPDSELRDSWVWFQSGLNTDGAHNPVTTRKIQHGDILSLNTFPMISGYYTALERTLFLGEPDSASLKIWECNVAAHELGLSLIKPGASCDAITADINTYLEGENMLQYRSFGYGHSFGILSHYYGREAGLELREDISTVLKPGMVISMEPMLTIPEGQKGAGGYREHDILAITESGAENITGFPYGPKHNIIA